MDNLSKEYQTNWRNKATEYFGMSDIKTLDPCRRPHDADLSAREIYELDLKDVKNSDLIFADTRPIDRPSWGTAMEIMYAHEVLHIPVIGWHEGGVDGRRIFLDAVMSRQFGSMKEAMDHIVAFYNC